MKEQTYKIEINKKKKKPHHSLTYLTHAKRLTTPSPHALPRPSTATTEGVPRQRSTTAQGRADLHRRQRSTKAEGRADLLR